MGGGTGLRLGFGLASASGLFDDEIAWTVGRGEREVDNGVAAGGSSSAFRQSLGSTCSPRLRLSSARACARAGREGEGGGVRGGFAISGQRSPHLGHLHLPAPHAFYEKAKVRSDQRKGGRKRHKRDDVRGRGRDGGGIVGDGCWPGYGLLEVCALEPLPARTATSCLLWCDLWVDGESSRLASLLIVPIVRRGRQVRAQLYHGDGVSRL